jgi:outer membrane protein assembly factor BamE (lipoprotein component of BamABCDE complex)
MKTGPTTLSFAIILAFAALSGCATQKHATGRPIRDDRVSQIVKGKTTIDDVITLFGAPTQQSEMAGNVLYVYKYTEMKGSTAFMPYFTKGDSTEQADELTITFDKTTGTVKTYSLQRGIDK